MSNYKLMPVEPTKEMVLAGARHLRIMSLPEREAAAVFRAMSAVAPVVQGEQLRYTNDGALAECPCCGSLDVGGAHDTVHCQSCGLTVMKPKPLQNAINAWNTRTGRKHPAPAVQGEPVGEAVSLPGAKGFTTAVFESIKVPEGTKLYASPQTAERQSILNLSEAARSLGVAQEKGDQGAIEHWGAMVSRFETEVIQSAEQKPAPDISQLLEALEDLVSEIENNTCPHDNTSRRGIIWEVCEDCGSKWADDRGGKPEFAWPKSVETARNLIHAYRKGVE